MEEPIERQYRQIVFRIPELTAWKIEKRIGKGTDGIKIIAKIFLQYFAHGKAGLDFTFDLSEKDMEKVATELEKQKDKPAA